MTSAVTHAYSPLRPSEKVLTTVTWIAAAALFATVGWMAMSPLDPRGAVTLLTRDGAGMIPQLAALAAAAAAVATALVGRKLPDAGTFAVTVGLAVANLQGASATYVLTYVMDVEMRSRRAVCAALAAESVVWFSLVALSLVVSGLVMRWCHGRPREPGPSPGSCLSAMSVADMPLVGRSLCGSNATGQPSTRLRGLLAVAVTFVVALLLFPLLAAGSPVRWVQHGQVYFALAGSFFVGQWLAYRLVPSRTALWSCLAVPLMCIMGYLWTWARIEATGGGHDGIASIPPTAYMRALPLDYISVGTAAVLASFWSCRRAAGAREAMSPRSRPVGAVPRH